MAKRRLKAFLFYLPFLVELVLLLLLYRYDFPQGDDFTFAVSGGSPAGIWHYYLYYYKYAGPRMANLFAQVLLLNGLSVWKILTPFLCTGISLLLFYWVQGRLKPAAGRFGRDLAAGSLCAFFPGLIPLTNNLFADAFLWMDGSCNYLYPLFAALLGALPFWNALRGRRLPRGFRWLCPVCLAAAGLLHEQIAVALFVFAAASLFLLRRDGKPSALLTVSAGISAAVTVYAFTCPGAYYRLHTVPGFRSGTTLSRLFYGLSNYFAAFGGGLWPIPLTLGLCALFFLARRRGKPAAFLKFYLGFGALSAPLADVLPLAGINTAFSSVPPLLVLLLLRMLYFAGIFLVFALEAHREKALRYLPALYLAMWGSQAIPAAIGSTGRAVFPLAALTILLALCAVESAGFRRAPVSALQMSAAALGLCAMLWTFVPLRANAAAYQKLLRGVEDAKAGKSQTVVIDQTQFQKYYFYYNAFSKTYRKEISRYYQLPKGVTIVFSGQ